MNTRVHKNGYLIKSGIFLGKGSVTAGRVFNAIFLASLMVLALVTVALIKSKSFNDFSGDYLLLGYMVLLTGFQLFRLTSVLFFRKSLDSITADLPPRLLSGPFEPEVTFVIPCKNEEAAIHTTISKCFAADYPRDKLEVIVINDGSTDRTGEIIDRMKAEEYPDLKVVHWEKNRGKRHGMNTGFTMAGGEIIIQLDSDSYIIPETFRKLIEPFRNPSVGAVCAHADPENAGENWISKMQAAYYFMAFRILKAAESTFGVVFCCSGCSSAYRKSTVMPLLKPWLEERFLGQPVTWGDDRALTSYVIKEGYKTIYTDESRAVTIVPATFRQLMKQQTRWKKSWIINAIFTSKFIWKVDPFIAFVYYYPLILVSLLTPFMAARAIFYTPVFVSVTSLWFFFLGILAVTSILVLLCKIVAREYKYWPYLFLWSMFSAALFSFLLFYAAVTIQNRSWGTR